jgi:hypothetical protein
MEAVPFAPYPVPPHDPAIDAVAEVLDPVLVPLGFAAGQTGAWGDQASVTFCRGLEYSTDDACVDLVVDLAAAPEWRIVDVRYWGFPAERWHLTFPPDGDLATQLAALAGTLTDELTADMSDPE